jgi:aspartate racemase
MRVIGLIGGISYVSTLDYYKLLNEKVNQRLGKLHSSKIALISLDLQEYATCAHKSNDDDDMKEYKKLIIDAATQLKHVNVDFICICSNTAHLAVPAMEQSELELPPVLHIADCCALRIKSSNIKRVALLGTKFTMSKSFLVDRLKQHDLQVFVPTDIDVLNKLHDIIEQELSLNIITEESRKYYVSCIEQLYKDHNIEGVILGCTEIPLLIKQQDVDYMNIKVFDSTEIHVTEAVNVQLDATAVSHYLPQ